MSGGTSDPRATNPRGGHLTLRGTSYPVLHVRGDICRVAVGMGILWEFSQDSHMGWEWEFFLAYGNSHMWETYGNPVGIPIGLSIDFPQIHIQVNLPKRHLRVAATSEKRHKIILPMGAALGGLPVDITIKQCSL